MRGQQACMAERMTTLPSRCRVRPTRSGASTSRGAPSIPGACLDGPARSDQAATTLQSTARSSRSKTPPRLDREGRAGNFISRSPTVAFRSGLAAEPYRSDKALGETMDKVNLQRWPTSADKPKTERAPSTGRARGQPRGRNGTRPVPSQTCQRAHAGNGREVGHVLS